MFYYNINMFILGIALVIQWLALSAFTSRARV